MDFKSRTNKYHDLLSNIGWFWLANFFTKFISFFMIPLYTYYLSTSEYGLVDLLNGVIQVGLPIFTLQMQDAVLRYSMDKCYEKKDILSIGVYVTIRGTILAVLVFAAIGYFEIVNIDFIYFFYFAVMYFSISVNNIFSYFCRAIDKVRIFTYSCILTNIITAILSIFLLAYMESGYRGYLVSVSSGTLFGVVYIFIKAELYNYIDLIHINNSLKNEMVKFSLPMIISALSWWLNNTSDRFFLLYYSGAAAVGVYAISYKLPMIISVMSNVISSAFSISAISEFDKDDKDSFLGICYTAISFFGVLTCSIIMLLNVFIAKILFSNDFCSAWKFVPPLIVAALMNQLSLTCENFFVALKKTSLISCTAFVSAFFNIIFNFCLIPWYGAHGAAMATMISYVMLWGMRYYMLKKEISIKNNIKKELCSYILIMIQMMLACFGNKYIYIQIIINIMIISIYYCELKIVYKRYVC